MADRPLTDKMQRVLVATLDAFDAGRYPPTPNEVGYALDLPRARRHRGPWSGLMPPSQNVITPIRHLCDRGLLVFARRRDGLSGSSYALTGPGTIRARALREAGVIADEPAG